MKYRVLKEGRRSEMAGETGPLDLVWVSTEPAKREREREGREPGNRGKGHQHHDAS